MDPESKKLLEQVITATEENKKILQYIKRDIVIRRIFSFIYLVLIVGSAIGAFYFVQPVLSPLLEVYGGGEFLKNLQNLQKLQ